MIDLPLRLISASHDIHETEEFSGEGGLFRIPNQVRPSYKWAMV